MITPYNDIASTRLLHALQDATDPKAIAQLSRDYAATQPPNSPRDSAAPTSEDIVIGKVLSLTEQDRLLTIQTLAEIADTTSPLDDSTNRGDTLSLKAIAAWNSLISKPQSRSQDNVTRLLSAHETFRYAANPQLKTVAGQAVITIASEPGNTFKQAGEFADKARAFLRTERQAALDSLPTSQPLAFE